MEVLKRMKILLVSHGLMAEGIIDSLKMLIGEVDGLSHITFSRDMGVEELTKNISDYLDIHSGNILIFTDLLGGTPFNVSSVLTQGREDVKVFYGMNLPIIIEAASMKDTLEFKELNNHIDGIVVESLGFSEL